MKDTIKHILADLRYVTIVPRRYVTPAGLGEAYWGGVIERYRDAERRIETTHHRWYVIEFKDGHKELARLRVLQGGLFTGKFPAIYRGFIPRRVTYSTFSHVKDFRLAF